MDSDKLRQLIEQQRTSEHVFIKWYSAGEAGQPQIESIDYFMRSVLENIVVDKFELLDLEQMWQELLEVGNDKFGCDRFERHWRKKVEVIDWHFIATDGSEKVRSCCFRAEGLLAVYEEVVGA